MDDELKAITSTLSSFYHLHSWQQQTLLEPQKKRYASFSAHEKSLLDWYPNWLRDLDQCIQINKSFVQNLATAAANDWDVSPDPASWEPCSQAELEKASQTLLQLAREWSEEGALERKASYQPGVDALCSLFISDRENVRVLVPGCGAGRLVFELVKSGFCVQGNESSYHMLMASGYMLNHVTTPHTETVFPYVGQGSHRRRRLHRLRPVFVPDESPTATFSDPAHSTAPSRMAITAGGFADIYGTPVAECTGFDAVVTCFFLDTAPNIVEYLQALRQCLAAGGVWVNMGALDWHHADAVDVSRDELFSLISKFGFEICEERSIATTYAADALATGRFCHDCDFWVARKMPID